MVADTRICPAARQYRWGFRRDAHAVEPELAANLQHQAADGGVEMHVLVRISVGERQTSCRERRELGADLGSELAADVWAGKIVHAEAQLAGWKLAIGINQVGYLRSRQDSRPFDDHEVQPDLEGWQGAGT